MTVTVDRNAPPASGMSRAQRLREATHTAHDRLDRRIMAGQPFRDRARYGRFLMLQYLFHRDIDALYRAPMFRHHLPDLEERRRLDAIVLDLADLGLDIPASGQAPFFREGDIVLPAAFGWLYVAEGSNLGAAFLLKEAATLGLGADFGARHLAGHPDGRGRHWRTFTAALDALELDAQEEEEAVTGARAAFARVQGLADAILERV